MENGNIVITFLPQANGKRKNRPALLLFKSAPFGDFVVCGISTQLHTATSGMDEILDPKNSDFTSSGLTKSSVIRTLYPGTISPKEIKGSIGNISGERYQRISSNLSHYFLNLSRHKKHHPEN